LTIEKQGAFKLTTAIEQIMKTDAFKRKAEGRLHESAAAWRIHQQEITELGAVR
jgi:hypothetical protein